MPTIDEISAAFEKGKEAVIELFSDVGKQVEGLAAQLEKQAAALKELQDRFSKNSQNSSKPPSSDGYGAIVKCCVWLQMALSSTTSIPLTNFAPSTIF